MGKVVVLGGNARSGKSTLAYELQKRGYNRISFDILHSYFENGLNIKFDDLSKEEKFNFFETVVNESINEANNENINIVIDMYDYLPGDIFKLKNKDKIEVYFLAYPNCEVDDIKYNVVHFAKPTDWIVQVNKEYLDKCAKRFYNRNKILVEECNKYNMRLVDTKSGIQRKKILSETLNEIIN